MQKSNMKMQNDKSMGKCKNQISKCKMTNQNSKSSLEETVGQLIPVIARHEVPWRSRWGVGKGAEIATLRSQ
jgi:hypothetical protein